MTKPTSMLLNSKINGFIPPNYEFSERQQEYIGTKKFTMMFGETETKWRIFSQIIYKGITIYLIDEYPSSHNFYARLTCMTPRIYCDYDDEPTVDVEAPMYVEQATGLSSSFYYSREPLLMKFEQFADFEGSEVHQLEIFIKIELKEGEFSDESKLSLYNKMMPTNFADLYRSGDLSDFTVVCADGVEIPVHRSILYGNSSVLKAMMMSGMKESIENKLEVKDIDGHVMHQILYFMYTQEVEDISDHYEGILYGAEKYQLSNLKTVCICEMIDDLCVGNAVEFFILASFYDAERLKELSLAYIQIHYDTLKNTTKWEQLELIEKAVEDYKTCEIDIEFQMNAGLWGHYGC